MYALGLQVYSFVLPSFISPSFIRSRPRVDLKQRQRYYCLFQPQQELAPLPVLFERSVLPRSPRDLPQPIPATCSNLACRGSFSKRDGRNVRRRWKLYSFIWLQFGRHSSKVRMLAPECCKFFAEQRSSRSYGIRFCSVHTVSTPRMRAPSTWTIIVASRFSDFAWYTRSFSPATRCHASSLHELGIV